MLTGYGILTCIPLLHCRNKIQFNHHQVSVLRLTLRFFSCPLLLCYCLHNVSCCRYNQHIIRGQFCFNRYLACEARGSDNGKSCDSEQKAYEDATYPEVTMVSYIVSGALPAMTIVFVIQFEKLKPALIASLHHLYKWS